MARKDFTPDEKAVYDTIIIGAGIVGYAAEQFDATNHIELGFACFYGFCFSVRYKNTFYVDII